MIESTPKVHVLSSSGPTTFRLSSNTSTTTMYPSLNTRVRFVGPYEPAYSDRKRSNDRSANYNCCGVDNKLFALPAHFESAALQLGSNCPPDQHNRNETANGG
ncbi:hypothetical protein FBUS_10339 [Fasciolopsis buskii]|uniref:Uncharacterized protein n=1 Tax=Fasciolopsis buskii TaxID=27845 RepID=A0A8E0VGQ5_9TREM|nr:hypothetical protein FBUS_10339 [Fasciolopsis buski]